jgi:hypothetical protein
MSISPVATPVPSAARRNPVIRAGNPSSWYCRNGRTEKRVVLAHGKVLASSVVGLR